MMHELSVKGSRQVLTSPRSGRTLNKTDEEAAVTEHVLQGPREHIKVLARLDAETDRRVLRSTGWTQRTPWRGDM